tara:strand:+ start:5314 stop:5688 length:375 start_codon:yes stop_codon:yes gene_type:complete
MLHTASTIKQPPKLRLRPIAEAILGTGYDVTVVFVGKTRARTLNQTTRNKDYVPNVLSFPLTKQCGEVYLCPEVAAREAKNFDLSVNGYLTYLFIHGCLHLKGHDHGPKMDKLEAQYCAQFGVR